MRSFRRLTNDSYEMSGNCYVASEALYHILGGKAAGWKPMRVRLTNRFNRRTCTHWFLLHTSGMLIDPAVRQFEARDWWNPPDYAKARGSGFLTKRASKRAVDLMVKLTWATLKPRENPAVISTAGRARQQRRAA